MSQETQTSSLMLLLKKHFNLVEEPFSANAYFFFEEAQRRHNIETLKHLSSFGDLVLFLTGEKGAGKTHLLKQFLAETQNELRSIYLDSNVVLQSGNGRQVSIIQACLQALGLDLRDERFEDSCARIQSDSEMHLAEQGCRTLLVLDCADKLPRPHLLALCGFCRNMPEESPLVVLFSGSNNLLQNSKLGANLTQDAWWHQIQLKPLASEEIADYLNQALGVSGYTGALDLTEQQLTQLVQLGKGLPGRINKIFPSVILEPGSLKIPSVRKQKQLSFNLMIGLAGLLVASFLIVAFQHGVFQRFVPVFSLESEVESEEQQAVTSDVDTQAQQQQAERLAVLNAELEKQGLSMSESASELGIIASENEAVPAESVSDTNNAEATQPSPVEQGASSADADQSKTEPATEQVEIPVAVLSSASDPVPSVVAASNEAKQEVAPVVPASPAESASAETQPKSVRTPQALKESAKTNVQSGETSTRDAAFREKSWLQAQPKGAYIPQILGSFDEKTAVKFARELGEQRFEIYYLETEHKGRPWFVVFYGVFATKAEAQSAIQEAPERIRRQKPWLRSVSSVLKSYPGS